jgi:hypothetical protein
LAKVGREELLARIVEAADLDAIDEV